MSVRGQLVHHQRTFVIFVVVVVTATAAVVVVVVVVVFAAAAAAHSILLDVDALSVPRLLLVLILLLERVVPLALRLTLLLRCWALALSARSRREAWLPQAVIAVSHGRRAPLRALRSAELPPFLLGDQAA